MTDLEFCCQLPERQIRRPDDLDFHFGDLGLSIVLTASTLTSCCRLLIVMRYAKQLALIYFCKESFPFPVRCLGYFPKLSAWNDVIEFKVLSFLATRMRTLAAESFFSYRESFETTLLLIFAMIFSARTHEAILLPACLAS